jgi:hypothetical protein
MNQKIKLVDTRLDVIFKREYAWAFRNKIAPIDSWYYNFYKEHIRAINNFSELNNNKKKFSDFIDRFHTLINEFENGYWDNSREKIELSSDGSIRNGGHRLALSSLYNKKFCEVIFTKKGPLNYNLEFFKKKFLKKEFYLYALERYIKHSQNCNIVVLFPSKKYDLSEIECKVKKKFKTIFTQDVFLNANGVHNLVLHMYRDQEWLSLEKNQGYSITLHHAQKRFVNDLPVKFMFIVNSKTEDLHEYKKEIRNELNCGNFPIHVPDNQQEVNDLTGLILRENGIIYLNNAKPKNNLKVHRLMKNFIEWINKEHYDIGDFCIVGSAYVSIEGHREVSDLDVLDLKFRQCPIQGINIIKKNSKLLKFYPIHTIFNPTNNFNYNGIKILSRSILIDFKKKRSEGKDLQDINYLNSNEERNIFQKKLNFLIGKILEITFWIIIRIRSVIPKSFKKFIKKLLVKII